MIAIRTIAFCLLLCSLAVFSPAPVFSENSRPMSETTQECLSCHRLFTPGIFQDWQQSRHANVTLENALKQPPKQSRVSLELYKKGNYRFIIGCAECHTLNPQSHKDSFEHNGYDVHIVVTPADCAQCHPKERDEFTNNNKMAHAYGNLHNNPYFQNLIRAFSSQSQSAYTKQTDNCYGCHGSQVTISGTEEIETAMNPISVPLLSGWPNTGVGRINPDGSIGACSACHSRHRFSMVTARHPDACRRCHHGSKSPAWDVFMKSKHGNLYSSSQPPKNLEALPWKLGVDFSAPNCAVCHAGLIVDPAGAVIVERTHGFSDRLWTRLYGLIYSHAQPSRAYTYIIRNEEGIPLPITFEGEPSKRFLITANEQYSRKQQMMDLCQGCHSTQLVRHHFENMEKDIIAVDKAVKNATLLMEQAWKAGIVSDINPFDEPLEGIWVEQWMFLANSIRYGSVMGSTPDYISNHSHWWELNKGLELLKKSLKNKKE